MLKVKDLDIPENPGVYLMKQGDSVIYVGKAKNLKKRVHSYFNRTHEDEKTKELVKRIEKIETIVCNSELDALILEKNLIKKYIPKYNILLKDEKTYPYIKFSKEIYSKISIIRTTKALDTKEGYYFGPYPMGAWRIKQSLIKIFQIRDCNRDMKKTYSRPCLKHYMNLCLGPCTYKNLKEEYKIHIEDAKKVLKGQSKELLKELEKRMQKSSEDMKFEEAILYRNNIEHLKNASVDQVMEYGKSIDEDIFTFKLDGKRLFICVLNIREGKMIGKNSSNLDISGKIENDLFQEVVINYYLKHVTPQNITFSSNYEEESELTEKWFNYKENKVIKLHFPKIKSRRFDLLEMAEANLKKDIKEYYLKKTVLEEGLMKLYNEIGLKKIPRRIECFDISNIQGKDAVGSMSVALEGKLAKKEYRKFRIKTKDTPDDFHMMREVMLRRYSKLKDHELPDLILIDGGLGQLSAVGGIIEELQKTRLLDVISIAKKEELVYKLGDNEPYVFEKSDESLKILQRLRDEAHRFGVTYHRVLRSKRVLKSELDDISGIGKVRKENLIKRFGSVKKIMDAELKELKEVVPEHVALEILKKRSDKR